MEKIISIEKFPSDMVMSFTRDDFLSTGEGISWNKNYLAWHFPSVAFQMKLFFVSKDIQINGHFLLELE